MARRKSSDGGEAEIKPASSEPQDIGYSTDQYVGCNLPAYVVPKLKGRLYTNDSLLKKVDLGGNVHVAYDVDIDLAVKDRIRMLRQIAQSEGLNVVPIYFADTPEQLDAIASKIKQSGYGELSLMC